MADENNNSDNSSNDEQLGENGLKALRAERDANKTLRAELKKLQDDIAARENEKLSEKEQLEKRATDAEARVKALQDAEARRQLRDKVAKELEVPAALLSGETDEELRASAEALKEYTESLSGPRRPEPNPHAGRQVSTGGDGNEDTDARAVLGF